MTNPLTPEDIYTKFWGVFPMQDAIYARFFLSGTPSTQRVVFHVATEPAMWLEVTSRDMARASSTLNRSLSLTGHRPDAPTRRKGEVRGHVFLRQENESIEGVHPFPDLPPDMEETTDIEDIARVLWHVRGSNELGGFREFTASDTTLWRTPTAGSAHVIYGRMGLTENGTAYLPRSTLLQMHRMVTLIRQEGWVGTVKAHDNGINVFHTIEATSRDGLNSVRLVSRLAYANPDGEQVREAIHHTHANERASMTMPTKTFRNRLSRAASHTDWEPVAIDIDGAGVSFDGQKGQVPVKASTFHGMSRVYVSAGRLYENLTHLLRDDALDITVTLAGENDPVILSTQTAEVAIVMLPMVGA